MRGVFISYRRGHLSAFAGRLHDRLEQELSGTDIWMDVHSIGPGENFVEAIEQAVARSDVLLVLIGPQWASLTDDHGTPRLQTETDFVRLEVAAALGGEMRVIPLLVDGATMPRPDDLPEELRPLCFLQAAEVRNVSFHDDVTRLIAQFRGREAPPASRGLLQTGAMQRRRTWLAAGLVFGAVAATAAGVAISTMGGLDTPSNAVGAIERLPEPVPVEPSPPPKTELVTPNVTLRWVPGGTFEMGSAADDEIHQDDEVLHTVTIEGLFVTRTEITQELWARVTGDRPSWHEQCDDTCPVERVSWIDAVTFANLLSARERLSPAYEVAADNTVTWNREADGYRLLTEAEWEWAARGGDHHLFAGSDDALEVGWIDKNSKSTPHPVCEMPPNGYGLCDMTGNVYEWVWDWYGDYPPDSVTNPVGPPTGERRVFRGGSWHVQARASRVAFRNHLPPLERTTFLGVRLARPAP